MKNKFLEIAGVATEEEFYNMFPSEEAFFQAYPEARQMKKGGNVPTNPQLYSRVKAEAKSKFDTWPSAYGSAWLVKTYKKRGGGYRKGQFGGMMGGINPENPFAAGAMNIMRQNQQNQQGSGDMMAAAMKFAPMLMGMPPMADGGKMPQWLAEKRFKAAGREDQLDDYGYMYGGNPDMMYGGDPYMMYGGDYMQNGGEPDGEMAMGQLMSIMDKAEKLRQFINSNTDLEPWVSSKLTMADDYIDGVADYMMYSEDEGRDIEVEEEEDYNMGEMEEMAKGGIPQRYKNKGFTKVGAKRKSTRPGKKWMVLAKKGDKYKVVHGGYKGMKDFSQHGSSKRKDKFWSRMGGKDSAKAKDPFSPLYWHKRFGTWQEGGEIPMMEDMMTMYNPYEIMKQGGIYIKPENRGKFTEQAQSAGMGVQEFASKVLGNKEDYSPTTVKRANFARNAAGWKKQMGGMMSEDMDMDSMYTMMRGGSKYQQGGERENQIMQAIQMYAQMTQTDPQELMKQIQALPPLEQEEAIQKIIQAIQQAQSPQASQMQMGGGINMGDTMDLDDMEIQRLMDMGYGVEYID
jgi:hypothetical protein